MANIAFVSYDVQTINGRAGGVGTFVTTLGRQLRACGHSVTIILTTGGTTPVTVDREWRQKYRSWDIDLIEIHNEWTPDRWPDVWTMRLSERVTKALSDFDIVYFSDWGNTGFNTVRMKRFGGAPLPICVTVLHGPSNWCRVLDGGDAVIPDHLHQEFLERYSARHSDYVVAPSRCIVDWAKSEGWQFRREPEIMGLPFLPDGLRRDHASATRLTKLIYFGRLERRKGYHLFVDALTRLQQQTPDVLAQVEEVVLLGHEDVPGTYDWVRNELRPTNLAVRHLGKLDSENARKYLAANAESALVVVPSAFENFSYAVIEASTIPGLNLICTCGGGTPEIFAGRGDAQLFEPTPAALAAKICERFGEPLQPDQLAQYDFAAGNQRWLDFNDCLCRSLHNRKPSAPTLPEVNVDVCVTYFNKARHFSQLLESLALQTYRNIRVISVDDGSTDAEAVATFDTMAERYRPRGWIFFRQDNRFVDAARNSAARRSDADYLLFVDADDVLAAHAVERLVKAAQHSGDDCLTPAALRFSSDLFPYDKGTGTVRVPITGTDMPLGPALASGLIDGSAFGGHVVLILRRVFERIGGYTEMRGAAHEDWELHARLAFAGCRTDILPEYLHFYRQVPGSLSRTVDPTLAKRRLIEQYDRQLNAVGLGGAAFALHYNLKKSRELQEQAYWLDRHFRLSAERINAFGFELPSEGEPIVVAARSVPTRSPAPLSEHRKKVLVIIPALDVGGAEMDLLRNLPRIDRDRFEIIVFTFLSRGALARQLAAAGIQIFGPFVSGAFRRRCVQMVQKILSFALRGQIRHAIRRLRLVAHRYWEAAGLLRVYSLASAYLKRIARLLPACLLHGIRESLVWLTYFMIGLALAPLIRRRNVDLIHTVLPNSYVVGSIANLLCSRPLIMSRVGLNWHHGRALYRVVERRLLHPRVTAAIGNCQAILRELKDEGVAEAKLQLVHNGIDIADFSWQMVDRNAARGRLGLSPSALVMSVVANLHFYKGHADLLQGLSLIREQLPAWSLVIVGRDVDGRRAYLEAMCVKLGISQSVHFLAERNDVPVILSAADIHLSCSHTEGLPNNIIEAMCARLPVIATAVGGVNELVIDEQNGLLVQPNCPIGLASAITRLAADPTARAQMGAAGRTRVETYFSIDGSVRTLTSLYARFATDRKEPEETEAEDFDFGNEDVGIAGGEAILAREPAQ
jgi:glycosyltransferase involved in cell wall biosynthesis/GT2 family glycosyltransferase